LLVFMTALVVDVHALVLKVARVGGNYRPPAIPAPADKAGP